MIIIDKAIDSLTPYERNPRKNDKAVESVANSIREFGFKVPIVIDADCVVIAGHTRLKAAKKLGLETVPCVVADDLTDEQIKAFRLADNKVSEAAEWDDKLLKSELDDILNIDMSDFGFDIPEIEVPDTGYYGDERERTNSAYNLADYDPERVTGFYDIPVLEPCYYVPEDLIGFNYVLTTKRRDAGVHFFIDDYQFERIWNAPYTYIDKLAEFPCVLTPDFSLYLDMPMAMKVWNVYRSRQVGQIMQDMGLQVIPTLQWAEESTFSFCFDGLPDGGTVAVSTVGVMKNKDSQVIWKAGMDEALRHFEPKNIILYGTPIDYDFGGINIVPVEARKGWQ